MTRTLRHPDLAPAHPGTLVAEIMEDQKGNKTQLAEALGVTRGALYNVLEEKSAVSAAMAVRIERALGISADMLVGMQAAYDLWRARQEKPVAAKAKPHKGRSLPISGVELFAKDGRRISGSAAARQSLGETGSKKPKSRKAK